MVIAERLMIVAAVACFVADAIGWPKTRLALTPLGLALWALTELV